MDLARRKKFALLAVGILILVALFLIARKPDNGGNLIQVSSPMPNDLISSPLTISGKARGFWYFEASFPAKLLDGNGKEIAVTPVQALDDWMTERFVPFSTKLSFTAPKTDTGTLVLEKDNPSGLPENDASIRIPIRFR